MENTWVKIRLWLKTTKGTLITTSIVTALVTMAIFMPFMFRSEVQRSDINAFNRDETSGARAPFVEGALKMQDWERFTTNVLEVSGASEMISKVESDSNAIGYTTAVSIFDIEGIDGTIEDGIKVLAFDDILPTRVNIDNGAYPISTLFSSFLRVENDDFENMQTSIINGDKWVNESQVIAYFFHEFLYTSTEVETWLSIPTENLPDGRFSWSDMNDPDTILIHSQWEDQNIIGNQTITMVGSTSVRTQAENAFDGNNPDESSTSLSDDSFKGLIENVWNQPVNLSAIRDFNGSTEATSNPGDVNGGHIGFQSRILREDELVKWGWENNQEGMDAGIYENFEISAIAIFVNETNPVFKDYEDGDEELNITTQVIRNIYLNGNSYRWSDVAFELRI